MKKYKNKIFDKIDYKASATEHLFYKLLPDDREKKWRKQRRLYGNFDERHTWSLNWIMTESIYTWLRLYLKFAGRVVNLDFHKFTIDGTEQTQRKWILEAARNLKYFLKHADDSNSKAWKKAETAYKIIGIILPTLWW